MNDLHRFALNIRTDTPGGCWLWQASLNAFGYGNFYAFGHPGLAHRAAYRLLKGPIPKGLVVMHSCDNPPCVNPDHLSLGTPLENIQDMDAKGRRVSARTNLSPLRGEANPTHKLTWDRVRAIRQLFQGGASKKGLARDFGVSRPVIRGIVEGRSWRDSDDAIQPPDPYPEGLAKRGEPA